MIASHAMRNGGSFLQWASSFAHNMDYTKIDSQNCADLSDANEFYQLVVESVVTDADGLTIEMNVIEWREEIKEELA